MKPVGNNLPIEDKKLLDNDWVRAEMEHQWDATPEIAMDRLKEKEQIWQAISMRLFSKATIKRYRIYKVSAIAATILLCIATGGLILSQQPTHEPTMYMVSTGKQDSNLLTLPDGTKLKLGAGSKLTYPEQFTAQQRRVKLEGQAFFDVAPNPDKRFVVEVGRVEVAALGTSFEVFCDKENQRVETILLTGMVEVKYTNPTTGVTGSSILSPDHILTVNLETGRMCMKTKNANEYSAWRNYDGLNFVDEKLSAIIPRLEYWYGVRILCESKKILDERFSFKVRNESLERILENISQTSSVRFSGNDIVYTLFE
ncbi:FecR domain-containing protein [Bacteroides sp. OttesenSCG-928-D19]|nr:FecR domain-containing protein [Bacteroides sp. OttesenSCG-928-D19]